MFTPVELACRCGRQYGAAAADTGVFGPRPRDRRLDRRGWLLSNPPSVGYFSSRGLDNSGIEMLWGFARPCFGKQPARPCVTQVRNARTKWRAGSAVRCAYGRRVALFRFFSGRRVAARLRKPAAGTSRQMSAETLARHLDCRKRARNGGFVAVRRPRSSPIARAARSRASKRFRLAHARTHAADGHPSVVHPPLASKQSARCYFSEAGRLSRRRCLTPARSAPPGPCVGPGILAFLRQPLLIGVACFSSARCRVHLRGASRDYVSSPAAPRATLASARARVRFRGAK